MSVVFLLTLNVILFLVGLGLIFTRKSMIFIMIGVELILQAAVSNFIIFDRQALVPLDGQVVAILSMSLAIGEFLMMLAIMLRFYQHFKHTDFSKV